MKKVNFIVITPNFLNDLKIDNILASNKISFEEKNYKYFIGYLDKSKIKPLTIFSPKTNAYMRSCDGATKSAFFQLKVKHYLKNITTFGMASAVI